MKKTVLIFGLIAGLIVSAVMGYSVITCTHAGDYEGNMVLGFASMFIAFSFLFIGIKSYRDNYLNGVISFMQAFKVGVIIAFIAATLYVVTWLIIHYTYLPNFMEEYSAYMIDKAKESGESKEDINKQIEQMNWMKEMYKNPIMVVLFTYMGIFPIGLVISIISALILKRRDKVIV